MRLVRTASCLAVSALALAACSKGGASAPASAGGGSAAPSMAAASAPAGPTVAVAMADLPHVKAGYWRVTGDLMGGVKDDEKVCYSGKTPVVPASEKCQMTAHRTLLGKYVIDGTCSSDKIAMKVVSHTTLSGDMQTHFVADATLQVTRNGKEDTETTHKEGTYIGPCPAGEEPVD